MVQYCAVPHCKNNALVKGISFHVFPKNPKIRRLWEIKVRRDSRCNAHISSSMRVCSEHFLDTDFKKTAGNKNRYLKTDAVPSVFPFSQTEEIHPRQDEKISTEGFQEASAQRGLPQSNLYSYLSEKVAERRLQTKNLTSNTERLDPKNLIYVISNKENADLNSVQEQNLCKQRKRFTYEKLVSSLSLIKKPNLWWTVSSASNFIICARWNSEYSAEKRIVIESTLTIRAFLKEMEINITDLMDIACIDDISSLLEKVEIYQDSVGNKS